MRYWILIGALITGCAADPNLTEEQRMERLRLAMQLLSPPSHAIVTTPRQEPQLDRCTTTINGNIANTVCR